METNVPHSALTKTQKNAMSLKTSANDGSKQASNGLFMVNSVKKRSNQRAQSSSNGVQSQKQSQRGQNIMMH